MDLDKIVLESGVALRGEPVASIGEDQTHERRQIQPTKHPQHANHIGYVLQVKGSDDNWYWFGGEEPLDPYTFEQAGIIIKEKQLDWPNVTLRIVGIVEVS